MFSCVEILQYLSNEQYEQQRDSKLSKEDIKNFLYNAEVRYAPQLRHLSNKTQSGSVTRESRIVFPLYFLFSNVLNILKMRFDSSYQKNVLLGYPGNEHPP